MHTYQIASTIVVRARDEIQARITGNKELARLARVNPSLFPVWKIWWATGFPVKLLA